MNLDQKIDTILTAVQNPPAATVDTNAVANAIAAAIVTALKPTLDAIQASVTDIQAQVNEPGTAA